MSTFDSLSATGLTPAVREPLDSTPPPSRAEIAILRRLDPAGLLSDGMRK